MGESPVITLKRHLDKRGVRNQQIFLLVVAAMILGIGAKAARTFGLESLYTIAALGGGTIFAGFALVYGQIVRSKITGTDYAVFHNRIEYRKSGRPLLIIPLSEIEQVSEERTQWQKDAGLTSVILEVRQESYLREESNIEYFIMADIPHADDPANIIRETMSDYYGKDEDEDEEEDLDRR